MTKSIAWIDEEKWMLQDCCALLELSGYSVTAYRGVEEFEKVLADKSASAPDFFIVDLMMPPGKYSAEQTLNGLITGLFLARDIRERWSHPAILFYTGTHYRHIAELAKNFSKRIPNCTLRVKGDTSVENLLSLIDDYFKKGRLKKKHCFKDFLSEVSLRFGVAGISFDLKKRPDGD